MGVKEGVQNNSVESSHYEFNHQGKILTGLTSMNALDDSCTVVWTFFSALFMIRRRKQAAASGQILLWQWHLREQLQYCLM